MLGSLFAPAKPSRIALYCLALTTLLFALQLLYWSVHIGGAYFPVGDDFALLVHSTRVFHAHPSEWLTRGFADYFRPYPDLAIPYSEFLRPVDNAVYFLNSLFFGAHWDRYLWANYLIASALVGVVFALCTRVLKLPAGITALVTVAAAASPAYTYHVLYRPSFAFDYLGALWALLCLLCLAERRLAPAWIFALLAVFSKESAYFVSPAAAIAVFFCNSWRSPLQRWSRSLAFCVPLLFVLLLRRVAYSSVNGVYVLHGLTAASLIKGIILGLTRWPYTLPGDQHIFARSAHNLGALLLTATLWLVILSFLWTSLTRAASRDVTALAENEPDRPHILLLIFLIGSLGLPILLNLFPRFGAAAFPLLFLTLGTAALPGARPARLAPVALLALVCITIINLTSIAGTFSARTRASQAPSWALSRNLVQILQTSPAPVHFLLTDDTEDFSSPEDLRRFAAISGQIVPVLNFLPGSCSHPLALTARPSPAAHHFHMEAHCGSFTLYGTGRTPAATLPTLQRVLPTATITYRSGTPWTDPDAYSWTSLDLDLQPRNRAYDLIALDPQIRTYQVLR